MPALKKRLSARRTSHPVRQSIAPQTEKAPPSPARPASNRQATPVSVPRASIPMTVSPGRLPSRRHTQVIRTTYNKTRILRAGYLVGGTALIALATAAWLNRSMLAGLLPQMGDSSTAPFHLTIAPTPTPDVSKLQQINARWQSQSSATAKPVDYFSSASAALTAEVASKSAGELSIQLAGYIERFSKQGVNINNLKAYQKKIDELQESGQDEAAKQWLVEAIVHAHELEMLQLYHQN